MAEWRVLYGTLDGTVLGELPTTSFAYDLGLNRAGSMRVSLPLRPYARTLTLPEPGPSVTTTTIDMPDLIAPNSLFPARSAVWAERGGIIQAGCIVWTMTADVAADRLDIAGEGFHSYFRRRLIRNDLVYTASDQGAIAKNLLEIAQLAAPGDLGVITPTPTASVARDRTYLAYERKSVGEAIEQLAAINGGFDWRYTPAWSGSTIATTFTTSYPATGRPTAHVFELGVNCDLLAVDFDGTTMANAVDALGAGEGNNMLLVPRADTASLAAYPLLEDVVTYKDVSVASTLEAHADRRLARGREPLTMVKLRALPDAIPMLGSYDVGDQVRVRGTHGWLTLDAVYRIVAIAVAVDDTGEQVSLDLAPLVLFS